MIELEKMIQGSFLFDELMSKHTSYGIGGPAKAYITPKNKTDLANILKFAEKYDIQTYFVGSGSNLLVSDDGIDGFVITLGKSLNQLKINESQVYAESGVMLGKLVKECTKRNLSGIESLVGVPGTLGGALIMNAGAFGGEISNFLINVNVMDMNGEIKKYNKEEIDFSYRSSTFPENEIIINAEFELIKSDKDTVSEKKLGASGGRKATQPLKFRSAGSVFKNPAKGQAAGYYIDQAGLKGSKVGDAEISPIHANFFVNHGNAKASDVVNLIILAKNTVKKNIALCVYIVFKNSVFKHCL